MTSNRPISDEDRRRFLKLAKDLGIGAGVVTLAMADPHYAAASGFEANANGILNSDGNGNSEFGTSGGNGQN